MLLQIMITMNTNNQRTSQWQVILIQGPVPEAYTVYLFESVQARGCCRASS